MNQEVVETTYVGRNNVNNLQLKDDSADGSTLANSDLSGADKVAIVFDDDAATSYNSVDDPTFISYNDTGVVTLQLGKAGLVAGSYMAHFIVYDPVNTDGVQWEPSFRVRKD